MKKYFLLMRGSQEEFLKLNETEQSEVIKAYSEWAKKLKISGNFVEGNGFCSESIKLTPIDDMISKTINPYENTNEQLSGYYIILAEDDRDAFNIANECPAFKYNESVEIIQIGH